MKKRLIVLGVLVLALLVGAIFFFLGGRVKPRMAVREQSKALIELRQRANVRAQEMLKGKEWQKGGDAALETVGGSKTPDQAMTLFELLRLTKGLDRERVMNELLQIEDPSLVSYLHQLLWDENPHVRLVAAMLLARFHDESSLGPLKEYAARFDLEGLRAMGGKGQIGQEEGVAYLHSLMFAIEGLGQIGDEGAVDLVAKYMGKGLQTEESGDIAAAALAKMGDKGIEAARKFDQENQESKDKLRRVVAKIQDPKQISRLLKMLGDKTEDAAVRGQAAIQMGLMKADGVLLMEVLKEKGVEEALLAGTKDKASEVRRGSYLALMDLDAKKHGTLLMEALEKEENSYVKHRLVMYLGDYNVKEAIPMLEKYLEDPDDDTKYWARSALKQLTGKKYLINVKTHSVKVSLEREEQMEKEQEMRHRETMETTRIRLEAHKKRQQGSE